ncbi:alpha-amylase family glycosyl hydrolase [uncultured Hymenobacter sp.]|uniref:alpha-amylase family glycosyl hydrolase n=1 Tax=uncultured Hymenobacter sp. TaxID=170016 RepID=UPI0035CB28F9
MKRFTLRVNLLLVFLLLATLGRAQDIYQTVGLIGTTTPKGWDASTPLKLANAGDPHQWTLTLRLAPGEAKFRANDSWDVNWGGSDFPTGTAGRGGANLQVPTASYYTVSFNDVTGAYRFEALNPAVYAAIGLVGDATASGWGTSTALVKSTDDPHSWTLSRVVLSAGELKFRANDSWDVSWGGVGFPAGVASHSGSNIPVTAGEYAATFNDVTGEYLFKGLGAPTYETVGLIGSATAKGWDASTPLTKGADGHTWMLANVTLTAGEVKFRANNAWDVNWGGSTFPTGVGILSGSNIPVGAGTYTITFNDLTREYGFETTSSVVVLSPARPTADESVTIIYDASKGVSGLVGAGKVYLHSGVVLSGPDGTAWSNAVGNWGQDDGLGAMTPVAGEPNKWQITLPSVRQYYGVAAGVPVFRLGMVFRNAEGTQVGKSEVGGDVFAALNPGNYVRFTAPAPAEVFGIVGQPLQLSAEASGVASTISLEVNAGSGYQAVAQASNSQTISYNYPLGTATSLQLRVTAQIEGQTVAAEKTLAVRLRKPNVVAALPAGLHSGINYNPTDPSKATLVLLAPKKEFVYVVGDFNSWQISDAYLMNQTPDGDYFWLELNNLTARKEFVYQYWVDGTIKIGDPYADKVADPYNDGSIPASLYPNPVAYNRTQDGIATVLQTGQQPYQWKFPEVTGQRPAKEDLVIYELLVRDFLGSHSYRDLADTLSYLKRLGVNTIELMPVTEFEGNESWGYNPSYMFAPDKYYGTKNDLKAFIDKAHEQGFVVLLDMVLNHQFGQSPMVRMYFDDAKAQPTAASPWFNQLPTHPFNVGYDFNHESLYTKRYIDDVNRYWLEEYKFDGYRFDLSKGFTQKNNPDDVAAWGHYDQSRIDILKRMSDKIWTAKPNAYISLEHLADNDEEKVLADYGIMLWGNLNHPYNDVASGRTDTDLSRALSSTRGWQQKSLVTYMESHDEERLMVRNRDEGLSSGDYNIKQFDIALERVKLASAFFYPLPGPKMLWQFGELGYDFSIDYNGRIGNKPIPWGAPDNLNYHQDKARVKLYKTTAAIINLVNKYSQVFEKGDFSWTPSGQFRKINVSHADMNVTIVGNFGVSAGSIQPGFQHPGTWYDFFSGKAVEVAATAGNLNLAPGEFHIFVDKVVAFPEPGLINIYTPIVIGEPGSLTAQLDAAAVKLKWVDNATGEQGYVLERKSETQSAFETVATLAENTSEYADAKVVDGVTYQYRVRAFNATKPSVSWSNTALIDLPLLAPANLTAAVASVRSVALRWADRSAHETGYVVERATQNGMNRTPFSTVATLATNATSFTDTQIKVGVTYYYRVLARDADEISDYSEPVSIRPATSSTATLQEQLAQSISMFPNPAASRLTFSATMPLSEPVKIQILNMQGTLLKTIDLAPDLTAGIQLDVSGWKEGVYAVQISNQDVTIRQLLMIQR